jgi:gluconolactonase
VVGDLAFSEGPAWHPQGFLLFEDIPRERILRLEADGKASVFREPSGKANGLAFDAGGRLVAAEGGSRRVSLTEKDGKVRALAEGYGGKKLNSPNDLAIDKQGRVYFTDPRYGDPAGVEQDREAVYRIDPGGKIVRILDDVVRPNGIAISADQRTLYLADNHPDPTKRRLLLAYDLAPDGTATGRRELHDFGAGRGADGLTLDKQGRLWVTAGTGVHAGVYVFEPNARRTSVRLLGLVATPETPTNCTFGDRDRRTLYITTNKSLFRIRTRAQGAAGLPGK